MHLTVQTLKSSGTDAEFESIKPTSDYMDVWDAFEALKKKYAEEGYEKQLEIDDLDVKLYYAIELATNKKIIISLIM
jgi:hypothetical protein